MGMLLVIIGLLFKLTAVPFHMWAPDVYEGAPTPVTAYFSTVPKLAVFAVTVRIFYVTFFDISLEWQKAITLCAIGSMILGTLGAMVQKLDLKRLLAYSKGNRMLLGISWNLEGLQGLLLAVIYLVMSINVFNDFNTWSSILQQKDFAKYFPLRTRPFKCSSTFLSKQQRSSCSIATSN